MIHRLLYELSHSTDRERPSGSIVPVPVPVQGGFGKLSDLFMIFGTCYGSSCPARWPRFGANRLAEPASCSFSIGWVR
jgi:hypothetical protein